MKPFGLGCPRCRARRHLIFDHIAKWYGLRCPNGCDGYGAKP